jgi:hypothetical protein
VDSWPAGIAPRYEVRCQRRQLASRRSAALDAPDFLKVGAKRREYCR